MKMTKEEFARQCKIWDETITRFVDIAYEGQNIADKLGDAYYEFLESVEIIKNETDL